MSYRRGGQDDRRGRRGVEESVLRVSGGTNAGATAGAIAARVRDNLPCSIDAAGAPSVSQALYALYMARQYLVDDGWDFLCQGEMYSPESLPGEDSGPSTVIRIALMRKKLIPPKERDGVAVKVTEHSRPKNVAGAIAHNIRSGTLCTTSSEGADAANVALKAISHAASFLEQDDIDIKFQPDMPYGQEPDTLHLVIHPKHVR